RVRALCAALPPSSSSALFPYTTLFRSEQLGRGAALGEELGRPDRVGDLDRERAVAQFAPGPAHSEGVVAQHADPLGGEAAGDPERRRRVLTQCEAVDEQAPSAVAVLGWLQHSRELRPPDTGKAHIFG